MTLRISSTRAPRERQRKRMASLPFPYQSYAVTAIVGAWCIAAFGYLSAHPDSWEQLGYAAGFDVWDGHHYALITSCFLHVDIIHLLFNLWWLWDLGRAMERALGTLRYLGFLLLAAIVSSGWELAVSGETGVGLSGVVYAMAAYMWIGRRRIPWFEVLSDSDARVLGGWFVLCIALTESGVWRVGNVAHGSGLVFGLAIAYLFVMRRFRVPAAATIGAMLIFTVVTLFWCPWSYTWRMHEASVALEQQDYARAERILTALIEKDSSVGWVWWSRGLARQGLGRIQESKSDFERGKSLDPSLGR